MLKNKQKILIEKLFGVLKDINEEALNDDEFYSWLNENYVFESDLEELIIKLKNIKEDITN
ncbi:MAG: hypothetical protein ACOCRX_11055 [Candidatus Woesearchaeota archaeon]